MAYCQADTSPKVGYRPYHTTDAFGAAHLSGTTKRQLAGLGTYYLNRPFDPWELYPDVHATAGHGARQLHGLGQNHPFKPQAWHLHGVPLDDVIPEVVHRAREAARRGDTFSAQSLVNTLKGLGSVPDPSTIAELEANGWDPYAIGVLKEAGASNEQLLALPYPASQDEMDAAFSSLIAQLQPAAAQHSGAVTAQSVEVPAGTELLYSVTWATQSITTKTPQDIAAAVSAALANKWGISVASTTATANFLVNQPTFSMHVISNVDHAHANDVKAIIDGEVYNAGRSVVSSSISIVKYPGGAAGPGAGAAGAPMTQLEQWVTGNALYIVGAIGAIVILPGLLSGGRRR